MGVDAFKSVGGKGVGLGPVAQTAIQAFSKGDARFARKAQRNQQNSVTLGTPVPGTEATVKWVGTVPVPMNTSEPKPTNTYSHTIGKSHFQ